MAYVQKSNATAPRSSYAGNTPATAASVTNAASSSAKSAPNKPTHNLSVMIKQGEAVEFINLTGLFPGETKDGRSMFKGKPKEVVSLLLADGRQIPVESFIITAKDK